MFVEEIDPEFQGFPEEDFDALVSQGKLVKKASIKHTKAPGGKDIQIRCMFYALPEEEGGSKQCCWSRRCINLSCRDGGRTSERVIGALLGFDAKDVEKFLEWLHSRGANVKSG